MRRASGRYRRTGPCCTAAMPEERGILMKQPNWKGRVSSWIRRRKNDDETAGEPVRTVFILKFDLTNEVIK